MSDTSYSVFQHYGTAAERVSFTPTPPAGTQPVYQWYETDTGKSYLYSTAWHPVVGVGGSVQVVNFQTGASATGTTAIPMDDTIPQNTEGDEYMSLAITPTLATNKLKIDVVIHFASNAATRWRIAALFQDATASALASGFTWQLTADVVMNIKFTHYMTAGTTSSTTFKVRAGTDTSGTTTFNGATGTRRLGGAIASSITITEIAV